MSLDNPYIGLADATRKHTGYFEFLTYIKNTFGDKIIHARNDKIEGLRNEIVYTVLQYWDDHRTSVIIINFLSWLLSELRKIDETHGEQATACFVTLLTERDILSRS
jgi:hypothetical protein